MAQKHHVWFVHPKDAHTNEVIARFTGQNTLGSETETLQEAVCEDGEKRRLWRISEQDAWFLWRSRVDLKFRVFNQLGQGKIRDVTFLFRRDRRSPKKRV